jgi:hypothetical protein
MVDTISVEPKSNVRTNVLHDYENYTYNLQLWALTKDSFNKLYDGILPGGEPALLKDAELLISNGGISQDENRSPSFSVDFGLDNLEIESIIGNRAEGKGADALNIRFDIIEPYSVTLLDRLSQVVVRNGLGLDFKTLIYCLKIQFLGYGALGIPQTIEGTTKYIPFTMLNMTFSITNKGAVYKCQGIPQKDFSMSVMDNEIPIHLEMQGSTLGELLGAKKLSPGAGSTARTDSTPASTSTTPSPKNLTKQLKDYEEYKVYNNSQKIANEYYFELDPALYDAIVIDPKKAEDGQRAMSEITGSKGQAVASGGRKGQITFDSTQGKFVAQAGSRLTDLLDNMLKMTDFTKKQVNISAPVKDKPVTLWKIFPKIFIKGYDEATNTIARKVTFVITRYDYYGLPHPNMGQKPTPKGCIVKDYDYMYTGANKDVMKVDIEYKIAFFEVFNALKDQYTENSNKGTGEVSDTTDVVDNAVDRSLVKGSRKPVSGIGPQQTSGASTVNKETIVVGELMNLLLDNAADMIRLDLQIVGDPDWVQQDNVLYEVSKLPAGSKTLTNGTISYYDSITCFDFNFKAPLKDYDDTTGIFDVQTGKTSAIFSGTYQVLKVTSNFSRGRFTQKLDNVRVRIQDEKQIKAPATSGTSSLTSRPIVQTNE